MNVLLIGLATLFSTHSIQAKKERYEKEREKVHGGSISRGDGHRTYKTQLGEGWALRTCFHSKHVAVLSSTMPCVYFYRCVRHQEAIPVRRSLSYRWRYQDERSAHG